VASEGRSRRPRSFGCMTRRSTPGLQHASRNDSPDGRGRASTPVTP
jgi:hypothetical protein